MRHLLKGNIRGNRRQLFLLWLFMLLETVILLYLPVLLSRILSAGNETSHGTLLCFIGLSFLGVLSKLAKDYYGSLTTNLISLRMVGNYVMRVVKAPLAALYKIERVNAVYAINNMSYCIPAWYLMQLPAMLLCIIEASVIVILLFRKSVLISIAILIITALQFLVKLWLLKKNYGAEYEAEEKSNAFQQYVHDLLFNVKTIYAQSMREPVIRQVHTEKDSLLKCLGRQAFWNHINPAENYLFSNGVYLLAVLFVLFGYGRDSVRLGDYALFLSYMQLLLACTDGIFEGLQFRNETKAGYDLYKSFRLEEETFGDHLIDRIDHVTFENVSFGYNEDEPILSKFNKTFKKGNVYVIKGENGSGKSTLINLLTGLVAPDHGTVHPDEDNLASCEKNAYLREHVAICDQSTALFFDTIDENICMGLETDEKLLMQCKETFGIRQLADHEGNVYSGGERQKIGLSRMLYQLERNDVDIVILDEPMNHLDETGKKNVLRFVREHKKDKILVVISHDNAFDALCDEEVRLKCESDP